MQGAHERGLSHKRVPRERKRRAGFLVDSKGEHGLLKSRKQAYSGKRVRKVGQPGTWVTKKRNRNRQQLRGDMRKGNKHNALGERAHRGKKTSKAKKGVGGRKSPMLEFEKGKKKDGRAGKEKNARTSV